MPVPPYPAILTQADWNRKKGVVARIVAEPTKLGEALKKAETAYKAVGWENIFNKPVDGTPLKAINDQIAKVGNETKGETNKLKVALQEVKTQATIVKGTWAANKAIPKDSKTHIDHILTAVDSFTGQLDASIKAGMLGLFAVQQQRAFLNEKEAKQQGLEMHSNTGPKKDGINTKFKANAPLAGKKPVAAETETSESESGA